MNANESRTNSPSATIIESSRLIPWMLMACLLAGISLGLSVTTIYIQATAYRELERESRLKAQAIDDLRASLIARGINPNNHDITDPDGGKP